MIIWFIGYRYIHLYTYMAAQKYKATPIRLKELKAPLQKEAMQLDRSLNWLIVSILKKHLKLKEETK